MVEYYGHRNVCNSWWFIARPSNEHKCIPNIFPPVRDDSQQRPEITSLRIPSSRCWSECIYLRARKH